MRRASNLLTNDLYWSGTLFTERCPVGNNQHVTARKTPKSNHFNHKQLVVKWFQVRLRWPKCVFSHIEVKQQFLANISKVTLIKRHDRFVYLRCPQGGRFLQGQFERSFRGSSHFHNFGSNPDTLKKTPF